MGKTSETKRVLLLTVGTGDRTDLERTLLTPLRKSIAKGEWSGIILLPSRTTARNADLLANSVPGKGILSRPLPKNGDEEDVDRCFAHFDAVIGDILENGTPATSIMADFTRGTKAMSAALVLAATRRDLPRLRYVASEFRDERGMVVPGTEKVRDVATAIATGRRRIDESRLLFLKGDFAAVLDLIPAPDSPFAAVFLPPDILPAAKEIRKLAEFCGAWDRLDYSQAAELAENLDWTALPAEWRRWHPPTDVLKWVHKLAAPPKQDEKIAMAEHLRRLACDLLANGERRTRNGQREDAVIRTYRVLELIGQIRLFDRGYDSEKLPPRGKDEKIDAFDDELENNHEGRLTAHRKTGARMIPRERAARLLARLDDDLAKNLLEFDKRNPIVKSEKRNKSILVHGYTGAGLGDNAPLEDAFRDLENLIRKDQGEKAKDFLKAARWLSFTSG